MKASSTSKAKNVLPIKGLNTGLITAESAAVT